MVVVIAAVAFLIVLIYFLTQQRASNDIWQSFRRRKLERRPAHSDQGIDETFNVDQPPTNSGYPSTDDPK
jgi:hypothetical protein